MAGEPDTVGRHEENMPGGVHVAGVDGENHRFAAAFAHLDCRLPFRTQMDMVAISLDEALDANGVKGAINRSMIENGRRNHGIEIEVHLDRMSLVRADSGSGSIKRKALFVTGPDDLVQNGAVHWHTVTVCRGDQSLAIDPSVRIEANADFPRLMAEDQAEEFANAGGVHGEAIEQEEDGESG